MIDIHSTKAIEAVNASTLLTAPNVSISVVNGGIGSSSSPIRMTNGANPFVLSLSTVDGFGSFVDHVGTGNLFLDHVTGGNFSLSSTASHVTTSSDLTCTGSINIQTNHFVNEHTVTSTTGDINIRSLAGSGLILEGLFGGELAAASGAINVTATSGNLTLSGKTTFTSAANLFAADQGQAVVLSSGSESIATVASFIFTGSLLGNGALTTIAPAPNPTWTLVNRGSYLNNPGDVVLSGDLVFDDLMIIASRNIDLTNASIDLSGANGGNLTLIAGFNFSLNSGGSQIFNGSAVIENFTPSSTGGSILGGASITTQGTNGSAGSVVALAYYGSISLGSVIASGTTNGGNVTVIGRDIQLGAVDTTGSSGNSGFVKLASGLPTLPSGSQFQIQAGNIIAGDGAISYSKNFIDGSVTATTINAGNSSIFIDAGHTTASINVQSLHAKDMTLSTGILMLGTDILHTNVDDNGNAGSISLRIHSLSTPSGHLILEAVGEGNGNGGAIELINQGGNAVTIFATGDYEFRVGSQGAGNGGTVSYVSNGDITLAQGAVVGSTLKGSSNASFRTTGNITVNASAFDLQGSDGDGARIELEAGWFDGIGNLNINSSDFFSQANGTGSNGDGGALALSGGNVLVSTSSANPLILTATGSGTGNGGSVKFISRSTTPLFVGQVTGKIPKPPATFITANATSGANGGNGGLIDIETGGNLTINMAGANANALSSAGTWNGASYKFVSGLTPTPKSGLLLINGNINARGTNHGASGSISLSSASTTDFSINQVKAPKNGIVGNVDAFDQYGSSGEINITNTLGGIYLARPGSVIGSGLVNLTAGGSGAIAAGAGSSNPLIPSVYAQAGTINLRALNGAIGGKGTALDKCR